MTGKELQKAIVRGEEIDGKEIVWIFAITKNDIEKLAMEVGYADVLRGDDGDEFLQKIKDDEPIQHELEKKIRRKVRQTIKKYFPADETESNGDEPWSFLGCNFPEQMD